MIDDDRLERALNALPLEEPPARLRARILAATAYRPAPVATPWEIWSIGTLIALAAWSLLWIGSGAASAPLFLAGRHLLDVLSPETMTWLGLGAGVTVWIVLLTSAQQPRRSLARR